MSELKITQDKVREAAAKCSAAAETLKVLFPEAFEKKDEPFEFGEDCQLSTDASFSVPPLYIGQGLAPHGLVLKCLVVSGDYEMHTQQYNGRTILTFHRKP